MSHLGARLDVEFPKTWKCSDVRQTSISDLLAGIEVERFQLVKLGNEKQAIILYFFAPAKVQLLQKHQLRNMHQGSICEVFHIS